MEHSGEIGQLAAAKAKAQAEFSSVKKDMTANAGKYSYNYADLAACLAAVVPALSKHGLALFQPVRVVESTVVATTLLVHESGEWISEEFGVPVVDLSDAQSIGSAATYAKRYGAQGLLGFAPEEEDDDGQAARGGDHPMRGGVPKACPVCGAVGSIIKSKPEYGGGYVCWKSKGGCETKWPEGADPTVAPPIDQDMMPKKKPAAASEGKPAEASASQPPAVASPPEQAEIGQPAAPSSSAATPGSKRAGGRAGKPAEPPAAESAGPSKPFKSTTGTFSASTGQRPEIGEGQVIFVVGPTGYVTNGLTVEQFMDSVKLVPNVDRAIKKGASKELLMEMFGVPTRLELTEEEGAKFLKALAEKLPPQPPEEEEQEV